MIDQKLNVVRHILPIIFFTDGIMDFSLPDRSVLCIKMFISRACSLDDYMVGG